MKNESPAAPAPRSRTGLLKLLPHVITFFVGFSFGSIGWTPQHVLSMIASQGEGVPANEDAAAKENLFDKMHRDLYQIASKPSNTAPRRKYSRGSVEGTGGGLEEADRELLGAIYYNSSSAFEFGLGESTHLAAYTGLPRYAGVDSVAQWISTSRDGARDHFRFSFADIGPTRSFGNPRKTRLQKNPFDYQTASLNNELEAFDFYLVDGRYRVSCACASFLHAMGRGGDMSTVLVGVHDWNTRTNFWSLLEVASLVHKGASLAVLRLRSNATEEDIFKLWKKSIWDYR